VKNYRYFPLPGEDRTSGSAHGPNDLDENFNIDKTHNHRDASRQTKGVDFSAVTSFNQILEIQLCERGIVQDFRGGRCRMVDIQRGGEMISTLFSAHKVIKTLALLITRTEK